MKCDELNNIPMTKIAADFIACKQNANTLYVLKADADAAIAELKQKLHDAEEKFVMAQETAIKLDKELTETRQKLHDAEMRADLAEADRYIARLKYKRCQLLASLSLEKRESYKAEYEDWCLKWYIKWKQLADHYREMSK